MKKREQDQKRQKWQERLDRARRAYQDELNRLDIQEQYYNGTRKLRAEPGGGLWAPKLSSNVRNIVYELIESQVDCTIPQPRVEAVHEEDRPLAKKIEALLRSKLSSGHFAEMNDLQERTVPIQGGSFWQVEWDSTAGAHCTLGDVAVTDRHPRQVIPQPGVYDLQEMDYLFLRVCQTKAAIQRRYGVDVSGEGEEEPGLRGGPAGPDPDAREGAPGPEEELVTQNIAYYRDENGLIGRFSWVGGQTLEDLPDYQARRQECCAGCGAPVGGEDAQGFVCPECGCRRTTLLPLQEETLRQDVTLFDGRVLRAWQGETSRPLLDKDGLPVRGEDGAPLAQSRALPQAVPCYRPGLYPLVLRRNIRRFGSLLGGSDVAVIQDQQDTIKKLGAKINEKILKGGSYVTLPEGVNVETTDRELKIIRLKNPAHKALIDVLNVQPDISKERLALDDNYGWAKSTLGITDAFQGKYDSSATSGTAKQFSANQSAGRLQSKREMKNQAYARLYELMFRFWLAYSDQPLPYSTRDEKGELSYGHFDRWEFLRQDAAGEWYWDDEFVFSVDPSATLSSNREALWAQIALNYQSGAFGPLNEPTTQALLWQLYELTGYPCAGQIRQAIEARLAGEESAGGSPAAALQTAGGAPGLLGQEREGGEEDALPEMSGGGPAGGLL